MCVCVCGAQGHTVPYNHSTSSLFTASPPYSVADNSCECGCECFRSALVRLVSLSEGMLVTATLLISNLPWCPLKGRRSKTKLLLHSFDGDIPCVYLCLCFWLCVCGNWVPVQLVAQFCVILTQQKRGFLNLHFS